VSDRRRAEELLVSAVDTLSAPFAQWDADEQLVIGNETFQKLNETVPDVIKPGETATVIFSAMAEQYLISPNGDIFIAVADNGVGIADKDQKEYWNVSPLEMTRQTDPPMVLGWGYR
jgi:hypothetical protein